MALSVVAGPSASLAATPPPAPPPPSASSPIIFPRPTIPLNFSHPKHLKMGMKCVSCHPLGATSIDAADVLLPKEEVCVKCHILTAPDPARAFPKSSCETCHPGFTKGSAPAPPPVYVPTPRIRMTHRAHTKIGIICSDCHGDMQSQTAPQSPTGWGPHMPVMGKCLQCHNGSDAPNSCTLCHLAEHDGRLVTQWPEGRLAPRGAYWDDDHRDPAWAFRHGHSARSEQYCQNCHATSDCLECHAGVEKPRAIHPGNWILLHSRDAFLRPSECLDCHEGGVGCQSCHETSGVTLGTARPNALAAPGRVTRGIHPEGWASFAPGPNHHSQVAPTSVEACASCHDEKECIACHSPQTMRINPHPPGFTGEGLKAKNASACLKCHDSLDGL